MRYLNRLVWAVVVASAVTTPAFAQQTGGGLGGGTGGTGGGTGGTGGGTGGGSTGSGQSMGQSNGTQLTQLEQAPQITAPGSSGTSGGSTIQDPVLGRAIANPFYQGTDANSRSNAAPGGFGQATYPTSAGTAAGGRGGATGARGGARGGAGGLNSTTEFGTIISQPIQLAMPAVPKFATTPISVPRLQADLSGMISRAPGITNPAGIQVITDGQGVTVRGVAANEDEARMIIGMVRMTPGVRQVTSELTLAK